MGTRGTGAWVRGRTASVMGTVYLLSLVFHSRVVQGIVPDSLPVRGFNRCFVEQVCPSSFDMT
jgi:drug/metabolite transporter superfamily protein YnfA